MASEMPKLECENRTHNPRYQEHRRIEKGQPDQSPSFEEFEQLIHDRSLDRLGTYRQLYRDPYETMTDDIINWGFEYETRSNRDFVDYANPNTIPIGRTVIKLEDLQEMFSSILKEKMQKLITNVMFIRILEVIVIIARCQEMALHVLET